MKESIEKEGRQRLEPAGHAGSIADHKKSGQIIENSVEYTAAHLLEQETAIHTDSA